MIREGKPTEDVDDLILKVIDAPPNWSTHHMWCPSASKDDLIQKALDDYEEMARGGKIHGFTPSEVNSLWFILKDLYEGGFFRDFERESRVLVFKTRIHCGV